MRNDYYLLNTHRTMKVKIELFATLRDKYKTKSIEVECDDFRSAIINASRILGNNFYYEVFDENDEFRKDRIITINGRNVKDLKKIELMDGGRIAIFPPIAGG